MQQWVQLFVLKEGITTINLQARLQKYAGEEGYAGGIFRVAQQ